VQGVLIAGQSVSMHDWIRHLEKHWDIKSRAV